MSKHSQFSQKAVALTFGVLVCAGLSIPALSFNLGTTNLGYTMLYPLTNLAYGPYYILNRVMMQTVYSPYGYTPYGGRFSFGNSSNGYNNLNNLSGTQNYSNYGPNGNQGNWNQQGYVNPSGNYSQQSNYNQPGNLGQSSAANNGGYNNQDPFASGQPALLPPASRQQPAPQQQMLGPNGQTQLANSPQLLTAGSNQPASASPSLAPSRYGARQYHEPDQQSFGSDFLAVLSNKYHDDVARAFKDNDVRAWAQALNIPLPDNATLEKMGHVRKQAIASVLRDNSLDTPNKIEALRILLH